MPLARYWSGDYVSPAMRTAWSLGAAYTMITPDGRIDIPPGQPIGGRDAPARRRERVASAPALFRQLRAAFADPPWDEADDGEIGAWRPDARAFAALLEAIDARLGRNSTFFGRLLGKAGYAPHLCFAQILLPATFDTVFLHEGTPMGSLAVVERELGALSPDPTTASAHQLMVEAVAEGRRRRLPLIIDT